VRLAAEHGDEFAVVEQHLALPQIIHLEHLAKQSDEGRHRAKCPPRNRPDAGVRELRHVADGLGHLFATRQRVPREVEHLERCKFLAPHDQARDGIGDIR
jgi:hypothetical protein